MTIQILGTGCAKCTKLAEISQLAAQELGLDYTLEKITDITAIMSFGVMLTPALAIDKEVKISGKVPSIEEVKTILAS